MTDLWKSKTAARHVGADRERQYTQERKGSFFIAAKAGRGFYKVEGSISRAEHEEFVRRMESENQRLSDEDRRQNKRLDVIEGQVSELFKVASNIERLATNMENMVKVQEKQGKRLETLESRDGEKWRKALEYTGFAILGAVLAIVFAKVGL